MLTFALKVSRAGADPTAVSLAHRLSTLAAILALTLVTLAPPWNARAEAVLGTVSYVAPNGSDDADGSLAAPWGTLTHALTQMGPGDTLVITPGDYFERVGGADVGFVNLTPATPTAPVLVTAMPGAVLHGLLWIEGADHWTFDGLRVTWDDANASDTEHMVRIKNGVGWTLSNSELWGARSFANLNVLSNVAGEPADWRITGNCIHDNFGHPDHGTAKDQLMYVNTGTDAGPGLIERNVLFNAPRGKAIKLAGPTAGTGSANVEVRYNTIADTFKPPVNLAWATTGTRIHHNLIGDTGEPTKGLVRGYQLAGLDNIAHDNHTWGADLVVFTDADSTATIADIDNTLAGDPGFDLRTCDGFHPTDPTAALYGRWAPDPSTAVDVDDAAAPETTTTTEAAVTTSTDSTSTDSTSTDTTIKERGKGTSFGTKVRGKDR